LLGEVLTAIVTPFRSDGSVDLAAFRALPAGDIEAMVSGFGPIGRCKISEKDRASLR